MMDNTRTRTGRVIDHNKLTRVDKEDDTVCKMYGLASDLYTPNGTDDSSKCSGSERYWVNNCYTGYHRNQGIHQQQNNPV